MASPSFEAGRPGEDAVRRAAAALLYSRPHSQSSKTFTRCHRRREAASLSTAARRSSLRKRSSEASRTAARALLAPESPAVSTVPDSTLCFVRLTTELSTPRRHHLFPLNTKPGAVDLEALTVLAGRAVWAVRLDVHVIDHSGSLAGAASLGVRQSISPLSGPALGSGSYFSFSQPATTFDRWLSSSVSVYSKRRPLQRSSPTGGLRCQCSRTRVQSPCTHWRRAGAAQPLTSPPLHKLTAPARLLGPRPRRQTRSLTLPRRGCRVSSSSRQNRRQVKEAIPLALHHLPVAAEFALLGEDGRHVVLDPLIVEEAAAGGTIAVGAWALLTSLI